MYYALIHNGKIVVGPRTYHKGFFDEYLIEQGLEFRAPYSYSGFDPIPFSDDVKILFVENAPEPEYNKLVEQLAGPTLTITGDRVIAQYGVADKELLSAKNEFKAVVAAERYNKECAGIKVTVQGTEVSVETARDERHIWLQAYLLLPDAQTQRFKFPKEQVWLDLTKAELGEVVRAIVTHVQSAFNWESDKVAQIDAAVTKEDLLAISLAE